MKILTILGARPQFIKAASVSRVMAKHSAIEEVIIHTGQHYDSNMSDIFFSELKIPEPQYFLGVGGKSHGAMTGQMIEKIEEVVLREKPDWVLIYGDTNSTLAGAVVASKIHVKLAHVEAGLRSFNMNMPEEINRILTDRVSNLLFCPTDAAINNLKNEGFDNFKCKIVKSGDVMQDGVIFYRSISKKPQIPLNDKFVLCTIHRAENTDDETRIRSIFEGLAEIAQDVQIILPLHPRTAAIVAKMNIDTGNINITEPVGYLEMVWLIDNCSYVITDSGGLQKEAYFFHKFCVTLRDETEWIELVEAEANILVGADKGKIVSACKNIKPLTSVRTDLYGGGRASEKIVEEILRCK